MPRKRELFPPPGAEPTGICECGCGQPVGRISTYTRVEQRLWTGYPVPYIHGHRPIVRSDRGQPHLWARHAPLPEEIPSGICECGCGLPTEITNYTNRRTRHFKGHPSPYLRGHTPGRFRSGPESHKWKGGRWQHKSGYIYVYTPEHPNANGQGYVLEHRLVMEQHLGRLLEKHEECHHISGVRNDNRIQNLQLRQGSHGAGHVFVCGDCGSPNIVARKLAD